MPMVFPYFVFNQNIFFIALFKRFSISGQRQCILPKVDVQVLCRHARQIDQKCQISIGFEYIHTGCKYDSRFGMFGRRGYLLLWFYLNFFGIILLPVNALKSLFNSNLSRFGNFSFGYDHRQNAILQTGVYLGHINVFG